jgi:hypothetical protein
LLCLVPGWSGSNFPKVHGCTFGTVTFIKSFFIKAAQTSQVLLRIYYGFLCL